MQNPKFPKSFPGHNETHFLQVLLASDASFSTQLATWKQRTTLDDLTYAETRLLPLLYLRLRRFGLADPDLGRLAGIYKLAWFTNHRLFTAAGLAVRMLEAHGVPVLVLKGMALLSMAYGDLGARFSADADIIVDPSQATRAMSLLLSDGWRLRHSWHPELQQFSQERVAATMKEITFVDAEGNELDVHIRLYEDADGLPEAIPVSELFARSIPFTYRGYSYRSLSPEHMLLHVIAHGAVGNVERGLRWVTDAVHIVRAFDIDWDFFLAAVEQQGFECEASFAARYLLLHGFVPEAMAGLQRVESLPVHASQLRAYFARGRRTVPYPLFGNVPRLWREYWRFEATGRSVRALLGFLGSARRAWGLQSVGDLPGFIVRKYTGRLRRLVEATHVRKTK